MNKIFKDIRTYFMIILIIVILWLGYQLIKYPILSTKYIIIFMIVNIVIMLLFILSQYKAKNKKIRLTGKILIIIFCLLLIPLNYTFSKTMKKYQVDDSLIYKDMMRLFGEKDAQPFYMEYSDVVKKILEDAISLSEAKKENKVSLDMIIHTMNYTGKKIAVELKETSLGGLASVVPLE